jgi:threonine aldolase
VLSFGGTKNGMLCGEAVVLFGEARTDDLAYVRKQSGQLASKSRFVAAQFIAMLEDGLWMRCAEHANEMAARLVAGAEARGVRIAYPVGANEVFAFVPNDRIEALAAQHHFYTWQTDAEPGHSIVRWVTSWDTTAEDVDALLGDL